MHTLADKDRWEKRAELIERTVAILLEGVSEQDKTGIAWVLKERNKLFITSADSMYLAFPKRRARSVAFAVWLARALGV